MTVDHITRALARLPEQLKHKTNFGTVLTALIRPFQDLESAFQDLLLLRGVLTATGAALTQIGDFVGEPRNGNNDTDYRRHIRARIFTNRSSGTTSELLQIASLIVYDDAAHIHLTNETIAVAVLWVHNIAVSDEMADTAIAFLRQAVAADGRVIFVSSITTPALTFTLDIGPGLDTGVFATARG